MSDMALVLPLSKCMPDPTLTLQLSNLTIITLHDIVVLTIGEVNGRGAVQCSFKHMEVRRNSP